MNRHWNVLFFRWISGGVVLNSLLNTLPPAQVRSKAQEFITMITECDEDFFPKVHKTFDRLRDILHDTSCRVYCSDHWVCRCYYQHQNQYHPICKY